MVPETLDYAWGFVVKDTELAGATLDIDWRPLQLTCPAGHRTEPEILDLHCSECGELAEVTGGNEFTIVDMEITRR